jgi:quercetin dioxygenase-like cupin family protein
MRQLDLQEHLANKASLPRTTTLFREAGIRALLLHLKPGEAIPEHQTRGPISVHCLAGEGSFFVSDNRVSLRPGVLISLPGSFQHSVEAGERDDLLLLVHISEHAAPGQ